MNLSLTFMNGNYHHSWHISITKVISVQRILIFFSWYLVFLIFSENLEFQSTSECLDVKNICDGVKDCQDVSDEANCPISQCPSGTFRCAYVGCLAKTKACDGEINWWEKSDEVYDICAQKIGKLVAATLTEAPNGTNRTTRMVSVNEIDAHRIFTRQTSSFSRNFRKPETPSGKNTV